MLSFYQQFAAALQQNPVVLATVVNVNGSVPREVGAMLLLVADGSTFGTIGGGAGEANVIEQARQVLATGEKHLVTIDLSGNLERSKQGICGGRMDVWLERWQGEGALALANDIVALLQAGQSSFLIIPSTPERSPYLSTPPPLHTTRHTAGFILPLLPPPTLLIVGAGHVAIPLAHLAHLIDFRVVVQDDRPEFASPQRFPDVTVLAQSIAAVVETLNTVAFLYVALVTRGYQHDLAALRVLLPRSPHYIGMIGSEKRVKTVLQAVQHEGIPGMEPPLLADRLQAIYAPIGLDVGALTPAEIAVSICAELISVHRSGRGRSPRPRSQSERSFTVEGERSETATASRIEQQAQQQ